MPFNTDGVALQEVCVVSLIGFCSNFEFLRKALAAIYQQIFVE